MHIIACTTVGPPTLPLEDGPPTLPLEDDPPTRGRTSDPPTREQPLYKGH